MVRWVVVLQYLSNNKKETLPGSRTLSWSTLHTLNRASEQVAKVQQAFEFNILRVI